MNEELFAQIDKIAKSSQFARPGDIGTLAQLLEDVETLRQQAELHQLPPLIPPAEAIEERVKALIMGESADEEASMAVIRKTVAIMQSHAEHSEAPPLSAYPAELGVGSGSGGDTGPAAAHAAQAPAAFEGDDELLAEYITEQQQRLEDIEGQLLDIERGSTDPALADLRRALHTIKGDSGFLGLSEVAQISHAAESYLDETQPPYDMERLFEVKDWLGGAFGDLATTGKISAATLARLPGLVAELERSASDAPAANPTAPVVEDSASAAAAVDAVEKVLSATREAAPADMDLPAGEEPPGVLESSDPDEEPEPEAAADEVPDRESAPLTADESLLVDFVSEAREHLDAAGTQLLLLESDKENEEAINSVFRAFHTVKGIAGFLALDEIAELAHATENLLDLVRRDELVLSAGVVDIVFEALDWMVRLIGNVSQALQSDGLLRTEPTLPALVMRIKKAQAGETDVPAEGAPRARAADVQSAAPESGPTQSDGQSAPTQAREERATPAMGSAAAAAVPAPSAPDVTGAPGGGGSRLGEILVESGLATEEDIADAVEETEADGGKKLGEVLVQKQVVSASAVHQALKQQALNQQAEPAREGPQGPRKAVELKETLRVDYERLEALVNTIGELVLAEAMISQDAGILGIHSEALDKKLYNLKQVSRKLQESGTTIRMVPISGTFQKMARLVRDLARKSNKKVEFVTHGDETELDRAYVDLIADPLVHMIRNSVDHGIESAAERSATGKDEVGRVQLRAFHEGGNIHVEIDDDGKGLDADRIFAKALEKGLVAEDDRERMNDQEVFQMIFLPGFSTAAQVTEVSGRGVGMDVVRRNIQELRGQVQIWSELGKGTTFRIILPLTMALIDGMLVRVGEERFIFPVLAIVESARPTRAMLNTVVGKGEMISLRGRQIPLYRLGRLFAIPDCKEDITEGLVVVVENNGRQMAVLVDELVGMQQTVIKSMGTGVFDAPGLSGGSIMADGRVGLIVDVPGLIKIARGVGNPLSV